jgi:hypothetical protein
MGLLTDFTVRDAKTKRRIFMIKTIIIILCLIGSIFVPQIMDIAYQQGRSFGKQICLITKDEFMHLNESKISEVLHGFEKKT